MNIYIYLNYLRMNGCIVLFIPLNVTYSFFLKTLDFGNSLLKSNVKIRISQTITHGEGYQH